MIWFFSGLPNYQTDHRLYHSMQGRNVVGYYYWILKNAGLPVFQTTDMNIPPDDPVVFHWDHRTRINHPRRIQVQLDRTALPNCEAHIVCDRQAVQTQQQHFIYQPIPWGLVEPTRSFPPRVIRYIGSRIQLAPYVKSEKVISWLKDHDMELRYQFGRWTNVGDEDLIVGCRASVPYRGHKSAAKLHTAWALGLPSIMSRFGPIVNEVHDSHDTLWADNEDELILQLEQLQDNDLYTRMCSRAHVRACENTHETIVQQWIHLLERKGML